MLFSYLKPAYVASLSLLYSLYLLLFFGVYNVDPSFVYYLSIMIHIFICLFLLHRFNPFTVSDRLLQFDKDVIFGSASFLLVNTFFQIVGTTN